jgi:hypothetical protein
MDNELKRTLTAVAIIEPEEPAQYIVDGAADVPGGFLLYAFGALGGAVLGGVMASKMEDQARTLTASLMPYEPKVAKALGLALKEEFEKRGVKVTMIPPPPRDHSTKKFIYANLNISEQAIVEPILSIAGYRLNSGSLKPMIGGRVRVLDAQGVQEKFTDIFLYGDRINDRFVTTPADTADAFPDLAKLYANPEIAVAAMRKGAAAIARSSVSAIKD